MYKMLISLGGLLLSTALHADVLDLPGKSLNPTDDSATSTTRATTSISAATAPAATPPAASQPPASQANGSNPQQFVYPAHQCGNKPGKPSQPPVIASNVSVDAYNAAVAQYNVRVAMYNSSIKNYNNCINAYIQSGNNDIEVIRKQLTAALEQAKK